MKKLKTSKKLSRKKMIKEPKQNGLTIKQIESKKRIKGKL